MQCFRGNFDYYWECPNWKGCPPPWVVIKLFPPNDYVYCTQLNPSLSDTLIKIVINLLACVLLTQTWYPRFRDSFVHFCTWLGLKITKNTHTLKMHYSVTFQQLVCQYEEQIKALKLELSMHDTVAQRGTVSYDPLGDEEKEEIAKQVNMFIDGVIPDIQVKMNFLRV